MRGMTVQRRAGGMAQARLTAGLAALALLAACGGGGGGSDGATGAAPAPTATVDAAPRAVTTSADAVRLGKQATFGPDQALVDQLAGMSIASWISEQFTRSGSTYADLATAVPRSVCGGLTGTEASTCARVNLSQTPVAMRFYADAVGKDDQLRQRVALALSEILVASHFEVNSTAGLATYQQILLGNAFGNYRDILKAITLNPYMGDYLDMADSNRTAPSENYARELMQLFSTGVDQLNMDGSFVTDASGARVPVYGADDVRGIARALTGWTYARIGDVAITNNDAMDYTRPMIPVAARYDTTAKTFLGTTVPAGATQEQSVDAVVDAVFANASTAPNVAKQLIQHLVTANPGPAYVGRVAAVFANNGQGQRGDMKAVIRAILLDPEARGDARSGPADGKLKSPMLFLTSLARIIGTVTDGYAFVIREPNFGLQIFRSPSVFNYYPPDFPLAQSAGLVSPAGKLMTTSAIAQRHNFVYDWTVAGAPTRGDFQPQAAIAGSTGTQQAWTAWEAIGNDPDALIAKIDLLMLNNTMTTAQRQALKTAIVATTNADATAQARARAQMALYVVGASPQFQVDR